MADDLGDSGCIDGAGPRCLLSAPVEFHGSASGEDFLSIKPPGKERLLSPWIFPVVHLRTPCSVRRSLVAGGKRRHGRPGGFCAVLPVTSSLHTCSPQVCRLCTWHRVAAVLRCSNGSWVSSCGDRDQDVGGWYSVARWGAELAVSE